MSTQDPFAGREPTEEELRAALEAQLEQISGVQVAAESAVSLINLAARRAGLGPEGARIDLADARLCIDAADAIVQTLAAHGQEQIAAQLREGTDQVKLAYARAAGAVPGSQEAAPPAEQQAPPAQGTGQGEPEGAPKPGEGPGPAQSSGRLWVPGR